MKKGDSRGNPCGCPVYEKRQQGQYGQPQGLPVQLKINVNEK